MMFVTRRGFSDACTSVGEQLELVSSSLASARRHLSPRIDQVDSSINECKELTAATKDEVPKLHGDLSEFHEDVESVLCAVQTLETKLVRIEANQDFATEGVYRLCKFVEKLEPGRNPELLQGLQVTNTIKERNLRASSSTPSNGIASVEESSGSSSSSGGFGWRIPGFSSITRARSTAG